MKLGGMLSKNKYKFRGDTYDISVEHIGSANNSNSQNNNKSNSKNINNNKSNRR